jgi:hypothetical protein
MTIDKKEIIVINSDLKPSDLNLRGAGSDQSGNLLWLSAAV